MAKRGYQEYVASVHGKVCIKAFLWTDGPPLFRQIQAYVVCGMYANFNLFLILIALAASPRRRVALPSRALIFHNFVSRVREMIYTPCRIVWMLF